MKHTEKSDTLNADSRRGPRIHIARQAMIDDVISTLPELCDEFIELLHRFMASLCDSRGRPK